MKIKISDIISSPEFKRALAEEVSKQIKSYRAEIQIVSTDNCCEEICRHCNRETEYCSCPNWS